MAHNEGRSCLPDTFVEHHEAQLVVDSKRIQKLQLVQVADYIGLVGLAEVNLDTDMGSAPSIMKLFRDAPDPPQGLSSFAAQHTAHAP